MGPCGWLLLDPCPPDDAGGAGEPVEGEEAPSYLEPRPPETAAEVMAIEYLWEWTGRRFGVCEYEFRPCRSTSTRVSRPTTFWGNGPLTNTSRWLPVLAGGVWFNLACGTCGTSVCDCTSPSRLRLPSPLQGVQQVWLDGRLLVEGEDWALHGDVLVLLNGLYFPTHQDTEAPLSEPGTWAVFASIGTPLPVSGQVAAAVLAREFEKAMCGDTTCALPQRLQSITRQGVTVAVLDNFEDLQRGQTGIWLIDSWVASIVNAPSPTVIRNVDVSPTLRGRR